MRPKTKIILFSILILVLIVLVIIAWQGSAQFN